MDIRFLETAQTELDEAIIWYQAFYESGRVLSHEQLTEYIGDAEQKQHP